MQFCALYPVLFSILFTINAGIGSYSLFALVLKKKMLPALSLALALKQQFGYRFYKMDADVKSLDIKNCTYHFFNDMINLKNFDSNLLKIDKKSYKNIDIYYIGYIKIKKLMTMKLFTVQICFT